MLTLCNTVPTYSESLRIGWTLLWRGTGSFVLLLTLCNILILAVLPELQRSVPSLLALLLPLVLVTCVATFGIMPFVVRTLFAGSYGGFRLQLVRNVQQSIDGTTSCETSKVPNQ
jgi:hypothetical protein